MDLDGLFWIALIVFYFVARSLGGRGRKQNRRVPNKEKAPAGERRSTHPGDELDAALEEIRKALGLPGGSAEERPESEPQTAREDAPSKVERTESDLETVRRKAPSKVERPLEPRFPEKTRIERKLESRPDSTAAPSGRTTARTPMARSPKAPDPHPIQSSFPEEELFERSGRHDHKEVRSAPRAASPYDAPTGVRTRGLGRSLSSRSSLREAIVLKEVLDRPISKRRR